jgi:hypothetical protein
MRKKVKPSAMSVLKSKQTFLSPDSKFSNSWNQIGCVMIALSKSVLCLFAWYLSWKAVFLGTQKKPQTTYLQALLGCSVCGAQQFSTDSVNSVTGSPFLILIGRCPWSLEYRRRRCFGRSVLAKRHSGMWLAFSCLDLIFYSSLEKSLSLVQFLLLELLFCKHLICEVLAFSNVGQSFKHFESEKLHPCHFFHLILPRRVYQRWVSSPMNSKLGYPSSKVCLCPD